MPEVCVSKCRSVIFSPEEKSGTYFETGSSQSKATTLLQANPLYPSAYFRKVVPLAEPVAAAELTVLHDDGVAVWVNGTQVFAKYVDDGTDYAAFATQTSLDNEVSSAAISLAPSPFVVGDNVIAAMVKQAGPSSSDVSFDLTLTVTLGGSGNGGGGGGGATGAGGGSSGSTTGAVTGAGGGGATGSGSPAVPGGGDGGCGCRAAGGATSGATRLGALAMALGLAVARRQRARGRGRAVRPEEALCHLTERP